MSGHRKRRPRPNLATRDRRVYVRSKSPRPPPPHGPFLSSNRCRFLCSARNLSSSFRSNLAFREITAASLSRPSIRGSGLTFENLPDSGFCHNRSCRRPSFGHSRFLSGQRDFGAFSTVAVAGPCHFGLPCAFFVEGTSRKQVLSFPCTNYPRGTSPSQTGQMVPFSDTSGNFRRSCGSTRHQFFR